MSAPFTPQQMLATPEYWNTRTDVPQLDDYDTIEDWQADLNAFLATQNATPAYPGLSPNSPNAGKSQAQIDAETLNRRTQWHDNGPGQGVALQNQINQNMPIIQSAYGAVDSDGTPLVADPLIAMLESMGVRPTAEQTAPRTPPRGGPAGVADPPPAPDVDYGTPPPGAVSGGPGSAWMPGGIAGPDVPDLSNRPGGQWMPGGIAEPAYLRDTPAVAPDMSNRPGGSWMPGGIAWNDPVAAAETAPAAEAQPLAADVTPVPGGPATIDPRYPDWLLLANRRRRGVMGQRPNDLMQY